MTIVFFALKSASGQHSQFLQCFILQGAISETPQCAVWKVSRSRTFLGHFWPNLLILFLLIIVWNAMPQKIYNLQICPVECLLCPVLKLCWGEEERRRNEWSCHFCSGVDLFGAIKIQELSLSTITFTFLTSILVITWVVGGLYWTGFVLFVKCIVAKCSRLTHLLRPNKT